jgi:stearoyl-CoA desaturase (delta-9 desaturase)
MEVLWMLLITVVIMQLSVFYTTIYLHRTVTHRGMEVHPLVAAVMHLHLSLFTGIVPREWAAVHRKHHQFSDKEGDPHSPRQYGLWKVFFGNAFYYRSAANDAAMVRKYTPDYKPTLVDKIPGNQWGTIAGIALFVLMFGWAWGVGLFIFQGIAYILLNSSINSICHWYGYRNFDNLATNIRWLSFLTGGEALHNNHHEYPTSAHFAMKRGEFDVAWLMIRALEAFGLATVKRMPAAKAA